MQKMALKLLAVSDSKQKLIGIVHYEFNPSVYKFEVLNQKVLYYVKSIDKNVSTKSTLDEGKGK